jgi:hypothetical protein
MKWVTDVLLGLHVIDFFVGEASRTQQIVVALLGWPRDKSIGGVNDRKVLSQVNDIGPHELRPTSTLVVHRDDWLARHGQSG